MSDGVLVSYTLAFWSFECIEYNQNILGNLASEQVMIILSGIRRI